MSSATISHCGRYRYTLERVLDANNTKTVLFIMLNPSTADANDDDPTIRKCLSYAQKWNYGRLLVGNLFAFRSTDPKALVDVEDPYGPLNGDYLTNMLCEADLVVCAWGNHGTIRNCGQELLKQLREAGIIPHMLRLNNNHEPAHPLYLPGSLAPQPHLGE